MSSQPCGPAGPSKGIEWQGRVSTRDLHLDLDFCGFGSKTSQLLSQENPLPGSPLGSHTMQTPLLLEFPVNNYSLELKLSKKKKIK